MSKAKPRAFAPLKFNFDKATDDSGRFYIYAIWNRQKDKYYVGISRNPATRINQHLKQKIELCEDYMRVAKADSLATDKEKVFQFFLLTPEQGYKDPLIACTAEVLQMEALEKQRKLLYNKNKFGAHHSIKGEERLAFDAIVKTIYPSLAGPPTDDNMRALEHYIPKIKQHVKKAGDHDIINKAFLKRLDSAWDSYLDKKKAQGFARKPLSDDLAFPDSLFTRLTSM